jgi:hypothetical protein
VRTTLLAAALLALASPLVHADSWTVTYHGMPADNGQMGSDLTDIAVLFSGIDQNASGVLDQDEVLDLSFRMFGRDYLVWPLFQGTTTAGDVMTSQFNVFSYNIAQQTFGQTDVLGIVADNHEDSLYFSIGTFFMGGGAPLVWQTANASSVTVEVVSDVSPVPEPSTWALLLAGLTCLGSSARARGRSTRER